MKTGCRTCQERALFRLDFALRGHAAYVAPYDFDELVGVVEHAVMALGAPLLRYVEHQDDKKTVRAATASVMALRTQPPAT